MMSTESNHLVILQVCPQPFTLRGGVSRIVQYLLEGLPATMSLSLACPGGNAGELSAAAASRVRSLLKMPSGKWTRSVARDFARDVAAGGFDLVHVHGGGTFDLDLQAPWRTPLHRFPGGTRWIYSNHCVNAFGDFLAPDDAGLRRIAKRCVAWSSKALALQRCRAEVFDSHENESRVRKWFPPWRGRMRTIYHSGLTGAPPEPVFRQHARCIGNLGHISTRKGQHDLFSAFRILLGRWPDLKLLLTGDHDAGGDARKLADEIAASGLGGAVQFAGGSSETSAFWREVDIYVQPSHFEGLPMALCEAMWHGKPCVATAVSGIPEVLHHEKNGLLCVPKNPAELAAAIGWLIADADLRAQMGRAAQETVRMAGISREAMSQAYAALYREVAGR